MTRSIYTKWIIGAVCILLVIAAGCILYYQQTTAHDRKEAAKDDKLLQQWKADKAKSPAETTPAESVRQTAEAPIKVPISNPNQSTEHNDEQNGVFTDVVHSNLFVEGGHNILESLALPTDAELAEYDQGKMDELIVKLHDLDMKVHSLSDNYMRDIRSLIELERSMSDTAKKKEIRNQRKLLERNFSVLRSEKEVLRQEKARIRQHIRSL